MMKIRREKVDGSDTVVEKKLKTCVTMNTHSYSVNKVHIIRGREDCEDLLSVKESESVPASQLGVFSLSQFLSLIKSEEHELGVVQNIARFVVGKE